MFFSRDQGCAKAEDIVRMQQQIENIQKEQQRMSSKLDSLSLIVERRSYDYIRDTSFDSGQKQGRAQALNIIHRVSVSIGYLIVAGVLVAAGRVIGAGEAVMNFFSSLAGK